MSDEPTGYGRGARSTRRPPRARPTSRRLGEFDFINRIRREEVERLSALGAGSSRGARHTTLVKGIGDDAAVISCRAKVDTVITADLLVEGIDFDLDNLKTSPRDLGHKALAVSLSDVASMGARPTMCLLSIGLPVSRWRGSFLTRFYEGVRALADAQGVSIIGGDISRTPERVVFDSVVLGEVARGRAVLRSGARPGDELFVTGWLGGAAAGLRILQGRAGASNSARMKSAERGLSLRQTRPTPRTEWGALLGERRLARAMIDLSDGLSSDLSHLCVESGVGARVEAERIPLDPRLSAVGLDAAESLRLALDGGEDFELLFAVRPREAAKLPGELAGVPVTRIGSVTDEAGKVRMVSDGGDFELEPGGFEHFRG